MFCQNRKALTLRKSLLQLIDWLTARHHSDWGPCTCNNFTTLHPWKPGLQHVLVSFLFLSRLCWDPCFLNMCRIPHFVKMCDFHKTEFTTRICFVSFLWKSVSGKSGFCSDIFWYHRHVTKDLSCQQKQRLHAKNFTLRLRLQTKVNFLQLSVIRAQNHH